MNPPRPGVLWASLGPVDGQVNDRGPDILRLRLRSNTYDLYFEPFGISDGSVRIVDVKERASRKLNTDPRRLLLSYKGRYLSHGHKSANEYDLKHRSEIVFFINEFAQDATDAATDDLFAFFTPKTSKEPQQTSGFHSPGWPGLSQTTTRRKPARFDPNTPGADEPVAPRSSAYAGHAQTRYAQCYADYLSPLKILVRGPSTEVHDSGHRESSSTRDASPLWSSARLSSDPEIGRKSELSPRYAMVGNGKTPVGEASRTLGLRRNPKLGGLFQKQLQRQYDRPSRVVIREQERIVREQERIVREQERIARELQATNDQSEVPSTDDVARRKAGDQLLPPEKPARPRSASVTDFHSIAAKAFEEDVFVWSSATRDLTPTMASVDTQSDRNLVYVGFLENDLRLEYKKYDDGGAIPLRTLAGSVWPLGWVMLKIFPFKVNWKSGVRERHRPQHMVFDVYETATFGDMVSSPHEDFL